MAQAKEKFRPRSKEPELPRSPVLLAQLLQELDIHIQFLRRFLHRQETRLAGMRAPEQTGPGFVLWRDVLAEIHNGLAREVATGAPGPERLFKFLNPERLQRVAANFEALLQREKGTALMEASVEGARQMVDLLEELCSRVVTALECDDCDKSCDKSVQKAQVIPRDLKPFELARFLNSRPFPKRPKLEVAREFTGGDTREAKKLLRQAYRYRLLETR